MKVISKYAAGALFLLLCTFFLICAIKLQSHPSQEFDEGVYLTTFRLVQHGFPLYEMTYHSQPPGFFLATYPLYLLGGSTLEAGRLAIFFYSLMGLFAILWLAHELDSIGFAFIAVGVLYFIPVYAHEILTFHSDALTGTFTILALAAARRYNKTGQHRWTLVSALMAAIAVMIKADVSVLPALLFLLLQPTVIKTKRIRQFIQSAAMFAAVFVLTLLVLTLPFGVTTVINAAFGLRADVAAVSAAGWSGFAAYISGEQELIGVLLASVVLAILACIRNRSRIVPLATLCIWVGTMTAILLVYRPLWEHHFVLLAIPTAVLFSYALYSLAKDLKLMPVMRVVTILFLIVIGYTRLDYALRTPAVIPTETEQNAINIVQANTQPGDFIVSDDGIVTALSERLTPPMFSDLSLVRIWSGSLTPDDFARNLQVYQPKMILAVSGRIKFLEHFDEIMDQYHYKLIPGSDADHRIFLLRP